MALIASAGVRTQADAVSRACEAMAAGGIDIDSVEELALGIARLPG